MLNFLEMFLGAILGNALYPYIRDAIKKRWGRSQTPSFGSARILLVA
jgi:hypothetical protein